MRRVPPSLACLTLALTCAAQGTSTHITPPTSPSARFLYVMRFLLPLLLATLLLPTMIPAQTPFPLQQYGNGGCGAGAYVPTFHTGGEFPVIGNSNFQVISRNLRGRAPGIVWISGKPAKLPIIPGLTLLVDPTIGLGIPVQANGAYGVAGVGMARIALPAPNDTNLVGINLFLQGFFTDTRFPDSLAHTQGLHLDVRQSFPPLITDLYDRVKYQALFKGATATQADGLGRQIWTMNAVKGFTYLKTQQFTCGGQSHWMVIVKHAQTGVEFALIPGGSYRMGDIHNLGESYERPVHWVHLEPFLLARTEVTQGLFTQIMKISPWVSRQYVKIGPNYAASYTNVDEASAFCAKLGCRLPTEAEWEYACRAGTTTAFHYGSNSPANLGKYAWYATNTSNQQYPHQVAQKLPNAFGLFDMHGNVWEWCPDRLHNNYGCAPTNGLPWHGGASAKLVDRGGSWYDRGLDCRCAYRGRSVPSLRDRGLGLRPACSLR